MGTSKTKAWTAKGCGQFLLWAVIVVLGLIGLLYWEMSPTTSPFFYASTLSGLKSNGGRFNHFPDSIPNDASHVRFYFDQNGFNGDYNLDLRFELPPEQIENLYQTYAAHNTIVPLDKATLPGSNERLSLPLSSDVTEGFDGPDWEVIIIDSYAGVAINRKSHEVLYWSFSM